MTNCDLYAMQQLHDKFDPPFPGFPGSDIDFNPEYSQLDEMRVKQFRRQYGTPMPDHLSKAHQPTDAFLGSYRDFEVYQSGCYPHVDTRLQSSTRPTIGWTPGPLASGESPQTHLNYSERGATPYHTHGTSMTYAYANPDLL